MTTPARNQSSNVFSKLLQHPVAAAAVVLIIYLAMAAGYAKTIPDWQAYDEPWHFTNADVLAREGRHATVEESPETHQPPLYYFVLSHTISSKTPYPGICTRLRLITILFGALALIVIFDALRTLLNDTWRAALLSLLAACIPMLIASTATITNDAAALLFGAITFRAMIAARGNNALLPHALLGAVAGFAILSKATCLFLGPTIFVFYLTEHRPLKNRAASATVCLLATCLVSGWWFGRNIILYGDPTGANQVLHLFAPNEAMLLAPREFLRWNALLFTHFWNPVNFLRNRVPGYPYAINYYELALTLLPFAGAALHFVRRGTRGEGVSWTAWVFLAALATLWIEIFSNSFRVYMPTGRFLFPAMIPLLYLWHRGVELIVPPRAMNVIIAVAALCLIAFNSFLILHVFPALPPMPFDAPFIR